MLKFIIICWWFTFPFLYIYNVTSLCYFWIMFCYRSISNLFNCNILLRILYLLFHRYFVYDNKIRSWGWYRFFFCFNQLFHVVQNILTMSYTLQGMSYYNKNTKICTLMIFFTWYSFYLTCRYPCCMLERGNL